MYNLWNFFIEKRQFTILVILGLVIWGGVAAFMIRKESSPEVQIPIGIVSVALPGASASDIERLVTDKIEQQIGNIANLDTLTSVSQDGVSIVTATFLASADLDESIQKLKDEVDKVRPELPEDATDPTVSDVNFVDQPIQLISVTTDAPFTKLAELGENLQEELQTVKGVSRADISGTRDREITVVVKKEELARRGMSLSDVTSGIAQSNAAFPIGAITTNGISYNIAFEGSLDEVPDIGSIPILDGSESVLLRDIATVSDGVERARSYSRISVGGEPSQQAITLSVYKVRGEDVTRVTSDVRTKLTELQQPGGLLDGSAVLITNDVGDQVRHDLSELTRVGLETVLLIMICLFITLGWREALIAAVSVPLSFLIAFVGLLYSGNTINFVSLFALILAIGILIDAGIVIVEAIHTRTFTYQGDKKRAAQEALREYAWPLIGGTMTSIVVFFPLFFIYGIVGKFIASIPYTLIFVLIASIFVALALLPTIAVMFSRPEHTQWAHKQEEYAERARAWYAKFLRRVLENRVTQRWFLRGMAIAFVLAIALPVAGLVRVSFFPQDDLDFVYVDVEKSQGSTLAQTDLDVRKIEETLYANPHIASFTTTVGGSSAFSNNPQSGQKLATITINLPEDRDFSSSEVVEELKPQLADIHTAKVTVSQPSGGPPVGAPVLVTFLGPDRDALDTALDKAAHVLATVEGTTDIEASNTNEAIQYELTIDRAKLAAVGLTPAQVAGALRTAVSGTTATSLTGGETDVDIVVSLNLNPSFVDPHEASNVSIDALRQIPLTNRSGQTVLLGSVLSEGLTRESGAINHEDRKRTATLTANVRPGATVPEVVAAFQDAMKNEQLPQGVEMKIGGENEETNQSFAEMGIALLAGIALMFVVLVLAFNSFRFTTYLLLTIPLSLIGVMAGLALFQQYLSFSSLLGVIALAGVIINHAIILMDSMIRRMRSHTDEPFIDTVVESATSRLRPIVLTTVTTVIGMIPLSFASALWGPLAFSIMFGLTFAMVLTLVFIPVLVYRWPGKAVRELRSQQT